MSSDRILTGNKDNSNESSISWVTYSFIVFADPWRLQDRIKTQYLNI